MDRPLVLLLIVFVSTISQSAGKLGKDYQFSVENYADALDTYGRFSGHTIQLFLINMQREMFFRAKIYDSGIYFKCLKPSKRLVPRKEWAGIDRLQAGTHYITGLRLHFFEIPKTARKAVALGIHLSENPDDEWSSITLYSQIYTAPSEKDKELFAQAYDYGRAVNIITVPQIESVRRSGFFTGTLGDLEILLDKKVPDLILSSTNERSNDLILRPMIVDEDVLESLIDLYENFKKPESSGQARSLFYHKKKLLARL